MQSPREVFPGSDNDDSVPEARASTPVSLASTPEDSSLKPRQVSKVWNYFETVKPGALVPGNKGRKPFTAKECPKTVRCLHCKDGTIEFVTLNGNNSTANAMRHLKSYHPEQYEELNPESVVRSY